VTTWWPLFWARRVKPVIADVLDGRPPADVPPAERACAEAIVSAFRNEAAAAEFREDRECTPDPPECDRFVLEDWLRVGPWTPTPAPAWLAGVELDLTVIGRVLDHLVQRREVLLRRIEAERPAGGGTAGYEQRRAVWAFERQREAVEQEIQGLQKVVRGHGPEEASGAGPRSPAASPA
jgi:hypothetical protein